MYVWYQLWILQIFYSCLFNTSESFYSKFSNKTESILYSTVVFVIHVNICYIVVIPFYISRKVYYRCLLTIRHRRCYLHRPYRWYMVEIITNVNCIGFWHIYYMNAAHSFPAFKGDLGSLAFPHLLQISDSKNIGERYLFKQWF